MLRAARATSMLSKPMRSPASASRKLTGIGELCAEVVAQILGPQRHAVGEHPFDAAAVDDAFVLEIASLPENGAAGTFSVNSKREKPQPDGAVEQPVVDRPAEPAANAGEVVHIGAERRRPWQARIGDVVVAIGERRGIALDAEQELAALVVVAELAADDGAVEVDGGQHGRRAALLKMPSTSCQA